MTDVEKLISIVKKEVGITEYPANSNKVKYNTWYYGREVSGDSYPWCVAFVCWAMAQAGLSKYFYGGKKVASCTTAKNYHNKLGQIVTSNYRKGDFILFNFKGGTATQHIGICLEYDMKTITTIDGNTGSTNEANGGAVMIRRRTLSNNTKIICGIRWYDEETDMGIIPNTMTYVKNNKKLPVVNVSLPVLEKGVESDYVSAMQTLLIFRGYDPNGVDRSFGPGSESAVKKLQKDMKVPITGKCNLSVWAKLLGG